MRAIGYAERDDDLLIRRGVFFQRTLVVPYGRMQYVDVGGRAGGTQPGAVHAETPHRLRRHQREIPGLPAAEGARLREQLSARGEARLAGL